MASEEERVPWGKGKNVVWKKSGKIHIRKRGEALRSSGEKKRESSLKRAGAEEKLESLGGRGQWIRERIAKRS